MLSPAEEFVSSIDDEGTITLSAAIAVSDNQARVVTVDTSLSLIGLEPQTYEFSFSITVTALDDGELPFATQDRTIARPFIPEESSPYVLPTVINALVQMVQDVQPNAIYRVTKMPNLPPKALAKHELITETLQSMNYEIIESGTDAWNRRFWKMERNEVQPWQQK